MVERYVLRTSAVTCFFPGALLDENSFPYPTLILPSCLTSFSSLPSLTHHLLPSRICGSYKLMKGALVSRLRLFNRI